MPGYNHDSNCTCGWCTGGGGGGGARTAKVRARLPAAGSRAVYSCDDFCNRTTCPICGAPVFFVRHNGGSVWFDELDPPWPKHSCFDDDYDTRRFRTMLVSESRRNVTPVFGVVIEAEVIDPGKIARVVVKCSDGQTVLVDKYKTLWGSNALAGALVGIERKEDSELSLEVYSSYLTSWIAPTLSAGAKIKLDGREYVWDGRVWYDAVEYTIAREQIQRQLNALVTAMMRKLDGK